VTEEDIYRALDAGEISLSPLAVRLLEREPTIRVLGDSPYRADALVEVSQNRRRWKFLAELKAASTPQAFDNALAAIQPAAEKAKLSPMVVMPWLGSERPQIVDVSQRQEDGQRQATVIVALMATQRGQRALSHEARETVALPSVVFDAPRLSEADAA